jgi:TM2 domain-containing membrane protein YozV
MERVSEKSAMYAYFFGIILPGLGQIYLNHKKRGLSILIGALGLSLTLTFLFAFPLNWIIMAAYWIWQVLDAFFLYKTENKYIKTHLMKNQILDSAAFKPFF